MRSVAHIRLLCAAACAGLAVLASCAVPRGECTRIWPGFEQAVFLVHRGREADEAMPLVGSRTGWSGATEAAYSADGVSVQERSELSRGARRWSRVFTISGVASGCEVVVHVPSRTADGRALAISVNGAPLTVEPGMLETVVPLARDGATEIVVSSGT